MTAEETQILMEMSGKVGKIEQAVADLSKQLLDNGQPGFITRTKNRLEALERQDVRRTWTERILAWGGATIISAGIAMHDHFFK